MNQVKIDGAVARLERNLPIRQNQLRLPASLRRLHRRILRHFLERGAAPASEDLGDIEACRSGIERLAAEHIIVVDDAGGITGAYPFVDTARGFRVTTRHGSVEAMCAFDVLAVSSMFAVPARIDARCRLSGQAIVIEQDGVDIRVLEPDVPVFAAIDWQAATGAASCSATLCLEMMFIAGEPAAADWRAASDDRETFTLPEAHALIAAVFVPLMR